MADGEDPAELHAVRRELKAAFQRSVERINVYGERRVKDTHYCKLVPRVRRGALLGIFPLMSGEGQAAPVSNEDMGRCAAALLRGGPERHAGRSYRPTGPTLLTGREMATIVAKVVGHGVRPVPMPLWLLGKVARQQGIDPYQISVLRYYMEDMKRGTFAFEGGVTGVVQALTGSPAESFETTARRYAALPFARQTLGNRLKAFVKFNLTPFYPGYNFDSYDRRLRLPRPAQPTLSIDDAAWRQSHAEQMAAMSAPQAT